MQNSYDLSKAIPNKLLNADGSISTIDKQEMTNTSEEYKLRKALPNKFLNPDGSYSTLDELLGKAVDVKLFIIVDKLPEAGNPQKIYLVPNGEGTFDEYHYDDTLGKWDPIGTLDISNLVTTEQLEKALSEAKTYTDNEVKKIVPMIGMNKYPSINRSGTTEQFTSSIRDLNLPVGTILLGTCELSDLDNIYTGLMQEEIKVEVYDAAYVYTMTSTDIEPKEWMLTTMGTGTSSDWKPITTRDWVNEQIDEKVVQVLGGEY